jgi:hypothetical protein
MFQRFADLMAADIDFDDFVETIFLGRVEAPGYYKMQIFDDLELVDLFECLLMIFTDGTRLRYGNDDGVVALDTLTPDDIADICRRFNSIGFNCVLHAFENAGEFTQSGILTYKEIPIYPTTKLSELAFAIKCGDRVYAIQFDLLPHIL